ncbi:MAG: MarR family winged helix-turn-helix transcriptional regulator [Blastocatellia bacterium]
MTEQGAGSWGLLRMLKTEGPQTVPDVARARSVSRQYIQKLANELIAEGWVALEDNPLHKKSRLMVLTDQGEAKLEEMTQRFRELTAQMASAFAFRDLQVSTHTVGELRKQVARLANMEDA